MYRLMKMLRFFDSRMRSLENFGDVDRALRLFILETRSITFSSINCS
jgi:hypothetical protein